MIEEIKKSFLKNAGAVAWVLGRHAFLVILFLFLVSILFGGFLVFRHVSLLQREPETVNAPVEFNEDLYRSVLEKRKIREDFLKNSSEKKYTNPFQ